MYEELVWKILAGGLLGMLGQGLRAVAGMKKINDAAKASGRSFGDLFSTARLLLSLFIGFTAGALAVLAAGLDGSPQMLDKSAILTVIAAGYAGTDFIEAFLSKAPGGDSAGKPTGSRPPAMG